MSKIDKILTEVYKNEVKLESQEVQLSLIGDAKDMITKNGNVLKNISNDLQQIKKIEKEFKDLKKRADYILGFAMKTINDDDSLKKINKTLKALDDAEKLVGVDIAERQTLIKVYQSLKSESDLLVELINKVAKSINLPYTPSKLRV